MAKKMLLKHLLLFAENSESDLGDTVLLLEDEKLFRILVMGQGTHQQKPELPTVTLTWHAS